MAEESPLDKAEITSNSNLLDHRNIVILGRAAVGKATLANVISRNPGLVKVRSPIEGMVCEPSGRVCVSCSASDVHYTIILIDIAARQRANGRMALEALRTKFKFLPRMNTLLLFVVRQGEETKDEREAFGHILKHIDKSMMESSVLVVTGCEMFSDSAKEKYRKHLCRSEITKDVAAQVRDILLVGLPAIEEMDEDTKELLISKRAKDVAALHQLCDMPLYKSKHAILFQKPLQSGSPKELDSSTFKDYTVEFPLSVEPTYDRAQSNECCLS